MVMKLFLIEARTYLNWRRNLLSIPGILSQKYKPRIRAEVGRAWPKTARNGQKYFKVKLTAWANPQGKSVYGKLLPLKSDPNRFDFWAETEAGTVVSFLPASFGCASEIVFD